MKHALACVVLVLATKASAQPADPGFYLRSQTGDSVLRIGGYMQLDARYFHDASAPSQIDQLVFRSIRPELAGTLDGHYDFRLLPDFAGGKLVVQEAYVDVHYLDALEVRFGKAKVPFGLERLQPEVATTFTERGLPTLLTPNRDIGVQVFGKLGGGELAYQLAIVDGVADNASSDGDTSDHKELVAHVLFTAIRGGPAVGAGATCGIEHGTMAQTDLGSWTTAGQTTFFAYRTGTSLADTAIADGLHWRATAHASWFTGPLGVMTEYVRSQQHVSLGPARGIVAAEAWQVVGQVVLAGGRSTFQGVVPSGRHGAFDLAARAGEIRMTDASAFAHGFADPTRSVRAAWSAGIGAGWLPDRSLRFMLDLDHTSFRGGARTGDRPSETTLIGRVQTVF